MTWVLLSAYLRDRDRVCCSFTHLGEEYNSTDDLLFDQTRNLTFCIKKWANPGLFFIYFRSFQTNITIFTTNICGKMSIQYMVQGSEPTTCESLHITTRPRHGYLLLWSKNVCVGDLQAVGWSLLVTPIKAYTRVLFWVRIKLWSLIFNIIISILFTQNLLLHCQHVHWTGSKRKYVAF